MKKIGAKVRPWESPNRKQLKWPPWRHQIWIFKIGEKNLVYLIRGKFHQNRSTRLGCRDDTDRHTDTHTHRDTDIIFPTFRFQTCLYPVRDVVSTDWANAPAFSSHVCGRCLDSWLSLVTKQIFIYMLKSTQKLWEN